MFLLMRTMGQGRLTLGLSVPENVIRVGTNADTSPPLTKVNSEISHFHIALHSSTLLLCLSFILWPLPISISVQKAATLLLSDMKRVYREGAMVPQCLFFFILILLCQLH